MILKLVLPKEFLTWLVHYINGGGSRKCLTQRWVLQTTWGGGLVVECRVNSSPCRSEAGNSTLGTPHRCQGGPTPCTSWVKVGWGLWTHQCAPFIHPKKTKKISPSKVIEPYQSSTIKPCSHSSIAYLQMFCLDLCLSSDSYLFQL